MIISYEFTDKEKELLKLFSTKHDLSSYNNFGGYGDTKEFKALKEHELIYHYNHQAEGDYIRYKLTKHGRDALNKL